MIKIAFIFKSAPYGKATTREGLDALLAATAFCEPEEIAVFFIHEGVLNLYKNQNPESILQKDFTPAFKLLEVFDIENIFICQEDANKYALSHKNSLIEHHFMSRKALMNQLKRAQKVLTF